MDIGVFASSCENLPITLLEMMGSGMQIACSNFSPMPEILGSEGIYFNPVKPASITEAMRKLIVLKKVLLNPLALAFPSNSRVYMRHKLVAGFTVNSAK